MINLLYIGNNLKTNSSNPSGIHTLGPLLEQEGFELVYASDKQYKMFRLVHMLHASFYFKQKKGIVIIDTYSTQNFYYALLVSQLCRLLNMRYLPILRGGNLPSRLENSPKLSRLVFYYAYSNIAPSMYLKTAFENKGYQNVLHIPNSITISNYPYQERSYQDIRLLWVRSFSKIYNPELAIKVLKALKNRGHKASLCMVGPDTDGSLTDCQKLAKELDVEVQFTGKLSKENWIALSKDFNIFINTTNFDNMPVSVIEAMALGLPVVSTNVGGMPFLIKHGVDGLLVEPNSAEVFVQTIERLVHNQEKTILTTKAARMKVEAYDWEQVKKQWFEVLQ